MRVQNISLRTVTIATLALLSFVALATTASAAVTGSLKITGVVVNGAAHPSDFTLQIKIGNSTISGSGDTLSFSGLAAGTHTITKIDGPSGYNVVWSGDCAPQGTVTIVPNITKQCTASYILGSVGTLKVNAVIKGGTANASDFAVHLKKSGEADTGSPSGTGSAVTFNSLTPGTYTVVPSPTPANYTVSWSGACNAQGTVAVQADRTATCTITYTFAQSGSGSGRTERPTTSRPSR